MLDVLIDTSSLISFAQITDDQSIFSSNQQIDSLLSSHPSFHIQGFCNTLESLILYDNIWYDDLSIQRNRSRVTLEELIKHCYSLKVDRSQESIHYGLVRELFEGIRNEPEAISRLQKALLRSGLISGEFQEENLSFDTTSISWTFIERRLPENLLELVNYIQAILGEFTNASGPALLSIIRAVYYQSLQQIYDVDLVLHPSKVLLYGNLESGQPTSIIENFEKRVRDSYRDRRQNWLGSEPLQVKLPMLTQYVLKKSNSIKDIIPIILEVRQSNKAIEFREGISQLRQAIEKNDNVLQDQIFSLLDKAAEAWSQDLSGQIYPLRKLTISVPMVGGLGIELPVPVPPIRKRPGDKILVFIHEILKSC